DGQPASRGAPARLSLPRRLGYTDGYTEPSVTDRRKPNSNTKVVPARGLEPRTLGSKVRPDLRMTPSQVSCRIRISAPRLLPAPTTAPAWLYKLAMHPKALRDRPARASTQTERPPPTSLR